MTKEINIEEIKLKLVEKLKPSEWSHKLRGFLLSSDFDSIIKALMLEKDDNKRFTPPLKQVFRAFEECPIKQLKVVMIGQDPYPQFGVADGISFSCGNTKKVQPSLEKMFEAINLSVYPDTPNLEMDPDLTRWANQGVLMLNSAFTCQVDKVASHYKIWQPFLVYTLDMLNLTNSGLIFVLLGNKAQEFESLIGPQHYIFKISHPASAAYTKSVWDCKNVFNEINDILIKNNGDSFKIKW